MAWMYRRSLGWICGFGSTEPSKENFSAPISTLSTLSRMIVVRWRGGMRIASSLGRQSFSTVNSLTTSPIDTVLGLVKMPPRLVTTIRVAPDPTPLTRNVWEPRVTSRTARRRNGSSGSTKSPTRTFSTNTRSPLPPMIWKVAVSPSSISICLVRKLGPSSSRLKAAKPDAAGAKRGL